MKMAKPWPVLASELNRQLGWGALCKFFVTRAIGSRALCASILDSQFPGGILFLAESKDGGL